LQISKSVVLPEEFKVEWIFLLRSFRAFSCSFDIFSSAMRRADLFCALSLFLISQ